MLVRDLSRLFQALADIAELDSDGDAAGHFRRAAAAVAKQHAKARLSEALVFWRGFWSSRTKVDSPRAKAMTARQAADYIEAIGNAVKPIARRDAHGLLNEFVDFLRGRGEADLVDTVAPIVPSTAAPSPIPGNDNTVAKWVQSLRDAGTNRVDFEKVIAAIQNDASIKLEGLNELLAGYTGSSRKTRSRKEAVERLRDHFEVDAQFEAKAASIDRMTKTVR